MIFITPPHLHLSEISSTCYDSSVTVSFILVFVSLKSCGCFKHDNKVIWKDTPSLKNFMCGFIISFSFDYFYAFYNYRKYSYNTRCRIVIQNLCIIHVIRKINIHIYNEAIYILNNECWHLYCCECRLTHLSCPDDLKYNYYKTIKTCIYTSNNFSYKKN